MSESLSQKYERILNLCGEVGKRKGAFTQISCPCKENHKHGDKEKSASLGLHSNGISFKCFAGCQTDDFLQTLGLTYKDLFPDNEIVPKNIYTYHNADGSYHHDKVKFPNKPNGKKDFRQRTIDENGNITWTAQGGIPYQYPDLIETIKNGLLEVFCYSPDTELLTKKGWVRFDALTHQETVAQYHMDNSISFTRPSAYQVFDYKGDMVNIASEWCDLLVTPDHRVLTNYPHCKKRIISAEQLQIKNRRQMCLPVSGFYRSSCKNQPSMDQAKFIVAWICDGYKPPRGKYNFNIKKERKKLRLRELMTKLNIRFSEVNYPSCPEWSQFWVEREDVKFLNEFVPKKRWTWDMLNWSYEIRNIMLEELQYWDGDKVGKKGERYFTAFKENAEIVSSIGVLSGWGSIKRDDNHNGIHTNYIVNLNNRNERSLSKNPKRIFYDGKVYCCTVSTGLLVTRRNGKTVIAGNCEGEKDCNTARVLGFHATTMGGASDWKDEYKNYFKDSNLILIPDKDDAGLKLTGKMVESLKPICKSLKILVLPVGKDLTEWVEAGNFDLQTLINSATELTTINGVPEPVVKIIIGGYEFYWIGLNIKIIVDHIQNGDDVEIAVYENEKPLYISGYKLLSVSHKDSLARALKKLNSKLNWDVIVNQITVQCLSKIREGEPIIYLGDREKVQKPEYLIDPLFPKNMPSIIYADRSSAKSLFLALVDIILTLGWYDNPFNLIVSNVSYKVLMLDWENDHNTVGWQIFKMLNGLEQLGIELAYLHCSPPLIKCLPQIQQKINEIGANVIIIDSLAVAVGGNTNDSEPALNFFSALRQLPVTPLVIAHTAKDINNKRKTVYGNAFYENLARSIWEVSKFQMQGSSELTLSLYQRKTPPFSGYHAPLGFRFMFDGDKIYVNACEPDTDERDEDK